jgi:hypothetical protein
MTNERNRLISIEGQEFERAYNHDEIEAIAGLLYVLGWFDIVGEYDFWYI